MNQYPSGGSSMARGGGNPLHMMGGAPGSGGGIRGNPFRFPAPQQPRFPMQNNGSNHMQQQQQQQQHIPPQSFLNQYRFPSATSMAPSAPGHLTPPQQPPTTAANSPTPPPGGISADKNW